MITYIKGKVLEKQSSYIIINVHGIGFFINISFNTYSLLKNKNNKKEIYLYTYLIIKENQCFLYGFFDKIERKTFQLLININGVGPKLAILILSSLSPEKIAQAILHNEVSIFKNIKGVGPKIIQRIFIELKDKITQEIIEYCNPTIQIYNLKKEAINGLKTLGVPHKKTEEILDNLLKKQPNLSIEELIKQTLQRL